jgi:hypothetical protein
MTTMKQTPVAAAAAQATGAPGEAPADDPLSRLADAVDGDAAQEAVDSMPPEPEAPALPPELVAGIARIPLFLLRALRSNIGKRIPEIHDEWTDDVLQGPADAVPPIIIKYAARLAPALGAYPEEAVLLLSTVPLFLGYMAASGRHESKALHLVERVDETPPAPEAPVERPQGFVGVPSGAES